MRMGTPVWFSESLARLPNELKSIKPTIFLAPPRVWERMYTTIPTEVKKRPAISRRFSMARWDWEQSPPSTAKLASPSRWMSRGLKIADKLVFSKVRERLGGRLRIAASGAAPLGRDLAQFFSAIGMPLIEGYGLTEGPMPRLFLPGPAAALMSLLRMTLTSSSTSMATSRRPEPRARCRITRSLPAAWLTRAATASVDC